MNTTNPKFARAWLTVAILCLTVWLSGCQSVVHGVSDSLTSEDQDRADTVQHTKAMVASVEGCRLYVDWEPTPVVASSLRYDGDCAGVVAHGVGTARFRKRWNDTRLDSNVELEHGLRQNGLLSGVVVQGDIYPDFVSESLTLVAHKKGTQGLTRRGATELETLFSGEGLARNLQKAKGLHDQVVAAGVPTMPWGELEAFIGRWQRHPKAFIQAGFVERLPDDPKARGRSARVK